MTSLADKRVTKAGFERCRLCWSPRPSCSLGITCGLAKTNGNAVLKSTTLKAAASRESHPPYLRMNANMLHGLSASTAARGKLFEDVVPVVM